jgi:hypothetical protein
MASRVDEYVAGLSGWQAEAVSALRRDILAAGGVTESFKWATRSTRREVRCAWSGPTRGT